MQQRNSPEQAAQGRAGLLGHRWSLRAQKPHLLAQGYHEDIIEQHEESSLQEGAPWSTLGSSAPSPRPQPVARFHVIVARLSLAGVVPSASQGN